MTEENKTFYPTINQSFSIMLDTKNSSFYLSDLINSPLNYTLLIIASLGVILAGGVLINKKTVKVAYS